ncbi:Tuberous sclerosis 2-like protein [Marasmius sp. AFHP31]|nr:Tuberous sclerosis 2-like protein [Marasmius sp. AFHP31]
MDILLEPCLPPAVPSLANARTLAQQLPSHSPLPPLSRIYPVLKTLCEQDGPIPLQGAGFDILAAYFEHSEANTAPMGTSDRMVCLSFFLDRNGGRWNRELWEPKFKALRAFTRWGSDMVGIEEDVVKLLKEWISDAFSGFHDDELNDNAERERSIKILTEFLNAVVLEPTVLARMPQLEDTGGALDLYGGLVDSSNHSGNPVLAFELYLTHLQSQLSSLRPKHLYTILPLLFRALARCATPLPRLTVTTASTSNSGGGINHERRIIDILQNLFTGPYPSTCTQILVKCLSPLHASSETPVGAARALRTHIRRALSTRLARVYISSQSSMAYTYSGAPGYMSDIQRDIMERAWTASTTIPSTTSATNLAVPTAGAGWDPVRWARPLRECARNWVDVGRKGDGQPDFESLKVVRERTLEELLGIVKDVLQELDLREEYEEVPTNSPSSTYLKKELLDQDEAVAVGELLSELTKYLDTIGPFVLPLTSPSSAPTAFLKTLSTLLARDFPFPYKPDPSGTNHPPSSNPSSPSMPSSPPHSTSGSPTTTTTPLSPPLTTILLDLASSQHLSDNDTARLVLLMKSHGELDGTTRWPAIFSLFTTPSASRTLTRTKKAAMQGLKEIYDGVKDMPLYRRRLGVMVLRLLSGEEDPSLMQQEDSVAQERAPIALATEPTLWKILEEEVILRCAEAVARDVPDLEVDESGTDEEDSGIDSFVGVIISAASQPVPSSSDVSEDVTEDSALVDDEHPANHPDPGAATPTPATLSLSRVHSRQPGHHDEPESSQHPTTTTSSSQIPSVISLLSSLSGSVSETTLSGGLRRNRSASTSMSAVSIRGVAIDPPPGESPHLPRVPVSPPDEEPEPQNPTLPTNLIAVRTLIGIFIQVGFSPGYGYYDSDDEKSRSSSIPITFKTLRDIHSAFISILSHDSSQTSTRVRLAVLQLYVRLRADRDHRLYLSPNPDRDGNGQIEVLAGLIGRVGVALGVPKYSSSQSVGHAKDDHGSGGGEEERELDALSGVEHSIGQREADAVSELRRARARDVVRGRRGARWGNSGSGSGGGRTRTASTSPSRSPSRSRLRRATTTAGSLALNREVRESAAQREWREHPPPLQQQTSTKQKGKEREREPEVLLWSCPEKLDFLDGAKGLSGLLKTYDPNSPEDQTVPVFPISQYLTVILELLSPPTSSAEDPVPASPKSNWELLSYLLVHLPTQLSNKHLFCGPLSRQLTSRILTCLCSGISTGQLGMAELQARPSADRSEPPFYPETLKPRDAHSLAYSTLSVLISYKSSFELKHRHVLVETLLGGLSSTKPHTITSCLHALSLCAYELQSSLMRYLKEILEKLSQIMSTGELGSAGIAVHILAFLSIVGGSGERLTGNFTEREFKLIFGVALKYLQGHNQMIRGEKGNDLSTNARSESPSGTNISWALSQHVRILSYHLVYTWFLALRLPDRPKHVRYITHQLLLANEGNEQVDDPTEVAFDWLARFTFSTADPRPAGSSALADVTMRSPPSATSNEGDIVEAGKPSGVRSDTLATTTKTWLQGNSVITMRTLPKNGWVEIVCRRPSGYTKLLGRLENVPMVGVGEVNPNWVDIPAIVLMDKDVGERKAGRPDVGYEESVTPREDLAAVIPESRQEEDESLRPDPITGYVWSKTAPSQRRKEVTIDPAFLALQLSPYPVHLAAGNVRMLVDPSQASRFCTSVDRIPVIDTHKVGILYVAPGQTTEQEILKNSHGSPAYTRFLEGLGRLINLRGQIDVYAGGLDPDEDGEYAYAWWDDIYQILYHTATLMPTHAHDEQCVFKKRHIGNDFVRIVWNDSGLPYRFDTLQTQFQFVNIVIEPHSLGAIAAFSNNLHENEYFKVTVQRAEGMMEFTPVGEFKLISADNLAALVRQLSLLSDWFAFVFAKTERDTVRQDVRTNWAERLAAIRRLRKQAESKAAEGNGSTPASNGDEPSARSGGVRDPILAQESFRDFTTAF